MEKSNIELIKEYLETCSLLNDGTIHVDYLNEDIDSYSIDETPSNPILKLYTDGGSLRQILFDFVVTEPFSKIENLKNSKFFEDFSKWIEIENRKGNLPNIEGAQYIKCTSPGYILQKNETIAIYIIQMQFVYKMED